MYGFRPVKVRSYIVLVTASALVLASLFGSFGNEPMQSCSVRRVSLSSSSVSSALASSALASASVYSCPSYSFDYRNFISCRYMHICPLVYAHEILGQCDIYF